MGARTSWCFVLAILVTARADVFAADWPMFGRDATRNAVSPESNPPLDWQVEDAEDKRQVKPARNVKWVAELGEMSVGSPVVSGGLVWMCTNNARPRDPRFTKDASVLMCFDARDGKFLWQDVTARVGDRNNDWPWGSAASPPLVEGDRLWYVTNRWEVVCLDLSPLLARAGEPREVWKLDMPRELGITPYAPVMGFNLHCAIGASYKGRLYVITGNGVSHIKSLPTAPDAPSLVCLEKATGKVVWRDNSPGRGILDGQWGSPLVAKVGGRWQVIAPMGDGWLRSFDPDTGALLWKCDANAKGSVYPQTRNLLMAAPVLYEGRVYIATGQSIERGEGPGALLCIDPTRSGDVSEELDDGPGDAGGGARRGKANPNSGVVWKFVDATPPGAHRQRINRMNRSSSTVAAAAGLVFAPDFSGYLHCLDARTGEHLWAADVETAIPGSPLICDGKVYLEDEDGEVSVFAVSREMRRLAKHPTGAGGFSSPVFANGVLYVANRQRLYAIEDPWTTAGIGDWPQWRGPNRTDVAADKGLLAAWPAGGPPLLWSARGLGAGVPSVAVARGRAYTLGYREDQEFLAAWDAATGAKVWDVPIGPAVAEQPSMRWLSQRTPTVDADRVYAFTARGVLVCVSSADGRERWRKDYVKDLGGRPGPWGYCDYPLVDGDRLICSPGAADGAVVALDKLTGDVEWRCPVTGCTRGTYAAVVAAEIAGRWQYVQQLECGAVGIGADGKLLWRYDALRTPQGNVHTAIVRGDGVYCSGGWSQGAALIEVSRKADGAFAVRERYRVKRGQAFASWFGNSALVEGAVFTNAGYCFDWATGAERWAAQMSRQSTLAVAEGLLYFRQPDGTLTLAEATPGGYVERGRFVPPRDSSEPAWTSPVIAGGRLYLRDQDQLLCYDVRRDRSAPLRPAGVEITKASVPAAAGAATAATTAATAPAATRPARAAGEERRPVDAIFVPTSQDVVERMLELATVGKQDVVYDLGCGDGRIVITAAKKYRCRAVGYDIDPECVRMSLEGVRNAGVGGLVEIGRKDVFAADFSDATVVTLYMGREVNRRLLPQLQRLKPGTRVVSHNFDMEGVRPEKVVEFVSAEDDTKHTLYLWTVPLHTTN